jgi:hypothetical protein
VKLSAPDGLFLLAVGVAAALVFAASYIELRLTGRIQQR